MAAILCEKHLKKTSLTLYGFFVSFNTQQMEKNPHNLGQDSTVEMNEQGQVRSSEPRPVRWREVLDWILVSWSPESATLLPGFTPEQVMPMRDLLIQVFQPCRVKGPNQHVGSEASGFIFNLYHCVLFSPFIYSA